MPGKMNLLVKNNLTLLDMVPLKGKGGTAYFEIVDI